MSDSPDTPDTAADVVVANPLADYATGLAERLGALGSSVEFDTVMIQVDRDAWVTTINEARKDLELFSWLSAIDWSKDVEVGEPVEDPDSLEERFEVMCRLSSVTNGDGAIFVATVPKDDARIDSLTPTIAGAEWHEREAHEMFGIDFVGNDHLAPLYLPDDFIGHPLLKSYPLISREVKPWPGDVDVEGMPEPEADADDNASDDGGDA